MKTVRLPAGSLPGQLIIYQLLVLVMLSSSHVASAQTVLPTDAFQNCTVEPDQFKSWFDSKKVSKDGLVKPADSTSFVADSNCSFYKWSAQMFLWLTSPRPPDGGSHIFSSPLFYAVEAVGADGKRTLRPQKNNQELNFAPNIALHGGKGQEVVFDNTGQIHNVIRPQSASNDKLLFRNRLNEVVAVARVATSASGKPLLLDSTEKEVEVKTADNGAPLMQDDSGKAIALRNATVLVDGEPRLVTADGDVVELGQAGGRNDAVLMAQNNSLVYYLIQVNDVFAYFRTGAANTAFNPAFAQFPTTAADLDKITQFANGAPAPNAKTSFTDGTALAVEVKSSWVEADGLSNKSDYLIIHATVPKYLPEGNNRLKLSGVKDVDLALVGFHVVGSMQGHPEMTWATFEHINNTPNLQYDYLSASGAQITRPADGKGPWLFSSQGANTFPIKPRLKLDPNPANKGDIVAVGPASPPPTIGPTDVTRLLPWGTAPADPNLFVGNNTDMVSINANIIGMLAAGDVRRNYIMIGATWTSGGKPPIQDNETPGAKSNQVGTNALANSTMETFKPNSNCLGCHASPPPNPDMLGDANGRGLSHVYGQSKALFTKQ